MPKIERVTGTGFHLLLDDIDTDRVIPARYLRSVTFEGLGEHAFEDDRKQDPKHPFDDPRFRGASIFVSGRNFGCGSSREHAPQALIRFGVRAIVGESFGEIFYGNSTSIGLPCVCASRGDLKKLVAAIEADPKVEITVDLVDGSVSFGGERIPISMPEGHSHALITGQYDSLVQLLEAEPQIRETAGKLPYLTNFV
jgi:3-isopropylmalate/(R)-2-methylmalate dehydratase small subunit